jgi:NADPH-dependent 2,4-dienoyl-CoA reductase/sulfur reductase-like enzyme/nitrite reductase/ring-hydroxylating ferredoxin subunit
MSADNQTAQGPDLSQGIEATRLPEGAMLLGHVNGEAVLLARRGSEVFAIGATCTHYSGPLAEGLLVDDTVRCPLHHACFSLRTGEALRAPALNPVPCWRIERRDGLILVGEKLSGPAPAKARTSDRTPGTVVIIGGGAAGNAAAEMLRREGHAGGITMLTADDALPYDRPNLSKDYLAGTASEDWIPLRTAEFYRENAIDVRTRAEVSSLDAASRTVQIGDGSRLGYDALLLATGARPVRLGVPGGDLAHVHYLRSLDDSRAIAARARGARRAVVIGASFIGLETAAALRTRGIEVHVVGPQSRPLERVLGPELGDMIKEIHEQHGVVFHLGTSAVAITDDAVALKSGEHLAADLVVAGIGVRPEVEIAARAGIAVDNGVLVDAYLETNVPGIFAAGDIARWPDSHTGDSLRVEHWVVAERQGQTAARNILGRREPFDAVPFFWSQHYDVAISYVGHAERWDRVEIEGQPAARNCRVTYYKGDRKLAVATVARDLDSLRAEVELERGPTAEA